MKTFSNFQTYCRVFGTLALMAAMSFVADDAFAKVVVKKVVTTGGGATRDGRGPSKREVTQLSCQGFPTYITTDNQNNTQVYVYDGENPSQFTEETISEIATEAYRVETDEDWSKISIFFGGSVGGTTPENPILVMDNGKIRDLFLGGYNIEEDRDMGLFEPTLIVKGGMVNYISVMGRNDCPLNGATISLSNMTYTGVVKINLARTVEVTPNADGSVNATYIFDDKVSYTCDKNSCTFLVPDANPTYDTRDDVCTHRYYISEVIPSTEIVTDGIVSVACKLCTQTWPNIHFSLYGNSGSDWGTETGYAYQVTEMQTTVPPTCQPGKALYKLTLRFKRSAHNLTYTYEGLIPAVEDVHDWDADGICHHTHYKMQKNGNGMVLKDNVGNILYEHDENGNLIIDDTPQPVAKNYVRKNKDLYYQDENGKIMVSHMGYYLTYRTWETDFYDNAKDMFAAAADNNKLHDKQVIAGLTEDFDIGPVSSRNFFTFLNAKEGIMVDLYGHTLAFNNSEGGYKPIIFNNQSVLLQNGEINANLSLYNNQENSDNKFNLILDNVQVKAEKIVSDDTLTLRNNSYIYLNPNSGTIICDNIVTDETSMWYTLFSDNTALSFADGHTVNNLLYTRECSESLAGKWQALMVPFSIEMTQEVLDVCDIAELYMISTKGSSAGGTSEGGHDQPNVAVLMKFELGDYTPASTPLFIRPKQAGTLSIKQNTAWVDAAEAIQLVSCATTKDSYELHGVYDGTFAAPDDGNEYFAPKNGSLDLLTGRLTHANRWYMKKESKANQPNQAPVHTLLLQTYGEDNINDLNVIEVVATANSRTYTLDGREVSSRQLAPGFYIMGNKKIVIR